jgi:uncharacterized membrane protein YraQ (UPF0718 family)
LGDSLILLWESLYGLVLGFLISAIVQVLIGEKTIRRFASDTPTGIAAMAGFGIISSSCSYASAAVARSLYHRGAGARASFAYLISSTNMNVAILILFWVLVGWKFALAEFLGGIIIIVVVATGLSRAYRLHVWRSSRVWQHLKSGGPASGDQVRSEGPFVGAIGTAESAGRLVRPVLADSGAERPRIQGAAEGDPHPALGRELVAVGARQPDKQAFSLQAAEVVGGLPG